MSNFKTETLNYDWKFLQMDIADGFAVNTNDSDWSTVRVPHDYAIAGPFSPENDVHIQKVIADGIDIPTK